MILFRADGNTQIGAGHIMRCLAIAKAFLTKSVLNESPEEILFITADGSLSSVIQGAGIKNHVLYTDYRNLFSELGQMQELIEKYHPFALFVDSYYVTEPYLAELRKLCSYFRCKLVYIDDVLEFPYPCDILLNYNIYGLDAADRYRALYIDAEIVEPIYLLGTSYTPLREEFQNLPRRFVRKKGGNILISTGGSDPEHIAITLLRKILESMDERMRGLTFHFVIGKMNTDVDEINALILKYQGDTKVVLHKSVTCMSELMQNVDLAISAAGSTLYELCATQTPTITYIFADNQILGAKGFEECGVMNYVGDYRELRETLIEHILENALDLAGNYTQRSEMAFKMKNIVDGEGAKRIVCELTLACRYETTNK